MTPQERMDIINHMHEISKTYDIVLEKFRGLSINRPVPDMLVFEILRQLSKDQVKIARAIAVIAFGTDT